MCLIRSIILKKSYVLISAAPAAKNVIFLSADAFGVLPPVSDSDTGTDRILLPVRIYSKTCRYGAWDHRADTDILSMFWTGISWSLHPTKYAEELVKKMKAKRTRKHILVNTGWNGTGKRISIKDTRGIIDAILNGDIANAPTKNYSVLQH